MKSEGLRRPERFRATRVCASQQCATILLEANLLGCQPCPPALDESSDASNAGLIYRLRPSNYWTTLAKQKAFDSLPVCFFAVGDFYKPSKKNDQEGGVPCVSG